jgi:hypothetical protein
LDDTLREDGEREKGEVTPVNTFAICGGRAPELLLLFLFLSASAVPAVRELNALLGRLLLYVRLKLALVCTVEPSRLDVVECVRVR